MLTGIRPATFKHLLLNEGIFLKDFDYSSATDLTSLLTLVRAATDAQKLGATIGGGSFECTPEIRQIEADGKRYEFVGSEVIDSWEVKLTATLKEVTTANLKMAFATGVTDASSTTYKTIIKVKTDIDETSYIQNLVWIGSTSEGALLIDLKNAMNTTGVTLTFEDKNEANIPVEFTAHQDSVEDMEYAPVTIVSFTQSGDIGTMTVSSAAGSAVGGTTITKSYTLGSGEHFAYKIGTASTAPSVGYHDVVDYTWTAWDGSSEIAVGASANGKKATFVVTDAQNRAKLAGSCTLAVKTS